MPKKKGTKSAGSAKKKSAVEEKAIANAAPTPLELTLRMELEGLERDLQIAKQEADVARRQVCPLVFVVCARAEKRI